ncbi:MAG: type III secretion system chaperone [Candidatus Endonucleobacter bathymodioli]|uniref:Type III secretion system chaperone n=1 Tax=Candidatus Endonucleibacter bathymodioli TaxID=539814 RepID=A0AA90NMN2_9GAMM|nr:type III secretion system chaperone [Candidatus Endonucleobacter bathymodioli]
MSFKQNIEENLQHFAKSIGLAELSLNEHDACGLCFDDTLIVNMEYLEEDDALVFVSSVRPIEAHDTGKINLYETMLSLNLQYHSMQGSFLALNHEKSETLLIKSILASADYGVFESALEKFVNTLEWVVAEIETAKHNSSDPSSKNDQRPKSPPPGGPDNMGMMV